MSLRRWAARRDANEPSLVGLARAIGAVLIQFGPLDWWCGYRGVWRPVEIKVEKGKFTPAQILFHASCNEMRLPYWTWRSPEDVYRDLNVTVGA